MASGRNYPSADAGQLRNHTRGRAVSPSVGVRRCEFCTSPAVYVQWLSCRDGRRRLFEADPVDVDQVPAGQRGWVPGRITVRGRDRVAMAPIDQVSAGKAAAARRVVVEHHCPRFRELYEQALGTHPE